MTTLKSSLAALVVMSVLICVAGAFAQEGDEGRAVLGRQVEAQRWLATAQGMPQNTVSAITQTRDGYIWAGTQGGLARFDGSSFRVFDMANTPGSTSNRILALYEDEQDVLWVGTDGGGLLHFEDGNFTAVPAPNEQGWGEVKCIVMGPDGTLWIGARTLVSYTNGQYRSFPLDEGLDESVVQTICFSNSGDLWMGLRTGVARKRGETIRHFIGSDGVPPGSTRAVLKVKGDILFSDESGTYRLVGERFEREPRIVDLDEVFCSLEDSSGRLILGGRSGVIRKYGDDSQRLVTSDRGRVFALFEDREKNLWIGTDTNGLACLSQRGYHKTRALFRGSDQLILDVYGDGESGVIAVNNDRAAVRVQGKTSSDLGPAPEFLDSTMFARERSGALWIGQAEHAFRYAKGVFTRFELADLQSGVQAKDGTVWLGGNSYVASYRAGDLEMHQLPGNFGRVSQFVESPDGSLWFSSRDGLGQVLDGRLEVFGAEQGLPEASLRGLLVDEQGVVWITTYGQGIIRFERDRVAVIDASHGLPCNMLGGIERDGDGFWINSNDGAFRITIAGLNAVARGEASTVDSLRISSPEGMGGTSHRTSDGRIWFPTIDGVIVINGARQLNEVPPLLAINGVTVDGDFLEVHQASSIRPDVASLEISYSALSFVDPQYVHFKYRLLGLDSTWRYVDTRRTAYFTKLAPGNYRFEVLACNNDGLWAEEAAFLEFYLEPIFYQEMWFKVLIGLAASALLLTMHRRRVAHLTREVRSERALSESEEQYRVVAETASDGIVTVDGSRMILYCNAAAIKLFGHTEDRIRGESLSFLIPAAKDCKDIVDLAATGAKLQGVHKDGSEFPIEVSAGMIHVEGGERSFTCFVRDITDRMQLEEQLSESKKMEAIGRLSGGISHDFNNILTAMIGYSEMLQIEYENDDKERALEYIEEILKCSKSAADLTRELLAFSRQQVFEPKVIDANDVLDGIEKLLGRLIPENIELTILQTPNIGNIKVDANKLEHAILNLAINAKDAMLDGGKLRLETDQTVFDAEYVAHHPEARIGPHVMFAISDTGTGISEAVLPHVFEPFFTTKAMGKGTGLGLASVYGTVKQAGGHILVYSEVDHGTTFKVFLPQVDTKATIAIADPATDGELAGNETILLCDDCDAARMAAEAALEFYGYTVLAARSPVDALELVADCEERIDAIITDVIMPGMNGMELADRIVKLRGEIPVLFVSGYTTDVVITDGVLKEGICFLAKPFSSRELLRKLREMLRCESASMQEML